MLLNYLMCLAGPWINLHPADGFQLITAGVPVEQMVHEEELLQGFVWRGHTGADGVDFVEGDG